jgi:hypothetical protein
MADRHCQHLKIDLLVLSALPSRGLFFTDASGY